MIFLQWIHPQIPKFKTQLVDVLWGWTDYNVICVVLAEPWAGTAVGGGGVLLTRIKITWPSTASVAVDRWDRHCMLL